MPDVPVPGPDDAKWSARLDRERRSRRQAEQLAERGMRELWLVNQNLEQKVLDRTAVLDRTVKALEQAVDVRQKLLADLGHELATPLHAITGSLELVDPSPLSPRDHALVVQARVSAAQLDGTLQAILAVSGISGGTRHRVTECRSPADVLDELFQRWQRRAAKSGKLLSHALNAESGDEAIPLGWERLTCAVDAVFDAAVQYADSGTIRLDLSVCSDSVSVIIEDSGPALPETSPDGGAPTPLRWASAGRRGIGLAVAQRMADEDGETLVVSPSDLGGIRTVISVKRPDPKTTRSRRG